MYSHRIISNVINSNKFLLTEDQMIEFVELTVGNTTSRLIFNDGHQLSRNSVKKVFKLGEGRIGKAGKWTFKVSESVPAVRIGCMRFEGSAFDAITAWISDRR